MKRALVTGAAGLIGSHVVDLLVREGWQVRALDNLEPQTHRRGKPAWINPEAEFIQGDMRNRDAITAALEGIDIVFHQAAYGGYMPEIAKYVHVNSLGTSAATTKSFGKRAAALQFLLRNQPCQELARTWGNAVVPLFTK